jgi:quercetin dioxygenase-like cupin family protein
MKLAYALAAVLTLSATSALAQDKAEKSSAVFILPSEIKWADVPGAPGVKLSVVEGDGATGAHHFFLKFPAGFKVGAHHHSADHFATIVSGTLTLTVDGKERKLPPGSYVGFTGKTKHATGCEAGADCVMFISAKDKWDAVMAETKPAPAKK